MNVLTLFGHVPMPVVAAWLASNAIPYLSALATRGPRFLTGALTGLLSLAAGFFGTWAAQGDGFDWKAALGAALVSWVVAVIHHTKVLAGTGVESKLYSLPKPTVKTGA